MTLYASSHAFMLYRGPSFRPDYYSISWLRPVMKDIPFLFLTATCTAKMKDEILRQFAVTDVSAFASVPNR
jgi:superfamily II DNA helicase RecQ